MRDKVLRRDILTLQNSKQQSIPTDCQSKFLHKQERERERERVRGGGGN